MSWITQVASMPDAPLLTKGLTAGHTPMDFGLSFPISYFILFFLCLWHSIFSFWRLFFFWGSYYSRHKLRVMKIKMFLTASICASWKIYFLTTDFLCAVKSTIFLTTAFLRAVKCSIFLTTGIRVSYIVDVLTACDMHVVESFIIYD